MCPVIVYVGEGFKTTSFNQSREGNVSHPGVDIYVNNGTRVFSMTSGTVTKIGDFMKPNGSKRYLKVIEIESDDGTVIRYGEVCPDNIQVKVGQKVKKDQYIAKVIWPTIGNIPRVQEQYMLHIEMYAGVDRSWRKVTGELSSYTAKSGYLYVSPKNSNFNNGRRRDLIDPTFLLTALKVEARKEEMRR